ncbi:LysR substrate-binding domain-containing protein [Advenella sp. RU8]|uniref:LysR substrate-binding domain-containing protein n=1 Tax=Advenella sp. RU8 TaxID=3399575 RepID=UPI003AAD5912
MNNLDLGLLRTLVTVEKTNTFSGAAEALFKTQSAVSQQMQRLEEQMGYPLFQKRGRHRELTQQGKQLAEYARRLLAINDEVLRTVGRQQMEGHIRFGATFDVADTILPIVLTHIARYAPKVKLDIQVDRSPALMALLASGNIDMAISTRDAPGLNSFVVRTSPTVWICAADFSYNRHSTLPLILADEPSIFRRLALTALAQHQIDWRINYLAPSLAGIKAAVRAGLGVTARSVEFLGPDMRVLAEQEGLPPLPLMTYRLLTRQDTINPLTLGIFEMLKAQFENTN